MRTPSSSLLKRELHIVQREHHIIERELALLEHQRQLEDYEQTLAARERAIRQTHPPQSTSNHQSRSPGDSSPPTSLDSLDDPTSETGECGCEEEGCKELAQARRELIRAADTDDTDAFMAKFWALYQRESQRKCGRGVDVGAGADRRDQ